MTTGFLKPTGAANYWLTNARLPATLLADPALQTLHDQGSFVRAHVLIEGGKIAKIVAADKSSFDLIADDPTLKVPLDQGIVLPCLVDMHTHLDKGHIWPRTPNPDGTFPSALANVGADRAAHWSAEDVRRRMDFALRCAYAHGTSLIRTHLDSIAPQHSISWPVFKQMQNTWAGRIDLQAVSLFGIDLAMDDAFLAAIVAQVAKAQGILGAVTYMGPALEPGLERLFRAAGVRGLDLDFHVDETADPAACSLRSIAQAAIAHKFAGRITVGHCCSLARQGESEADRTMDLVAEAKIAVVSLPMCNMYLQDRVAGRTPRWRGVTLLHEMAARGIPVAVASDNTRDPFYAYGDLDLIEVFREGVRILHLDHPFGDWPRVVTTTPAHIMRRPDHGILQVGANADLVVFQARTWSELLSRPQANRSVIRGGVIIDRTLPDYRELDDLESFLSPDAAQLKGRPHA